MSRVRPSILSVRSADSKLIVHSSLTLGCTVLLITSLPVVSVEAAGLSGLVIAIIFIGLGRGGLKAILYPFIGRHDRITSVTTCSADCANR